MAKKGKVETGGKVVDLDARSVSSEVSIRRMEAGRVACERTLRVRFDFADVPEWRVYDLAHAAAVIRWANTVRPSLGTDNDELGGKTLHTVRVADLEKRATLTPFERFVRGVAAAKGTTPGALMDSDEWPAICETARTLGLEGIPTN